MYKIGSHLIQIPLSDLSPTQITVGFREVREKRESWRELSRKARRAAMNEELFPVIKGRGSRFFILDHHHTALALIHEQAESVQAGIVNDLSELKVEDFWAFLDHHGWVHAYDDKGRRRPFKDIPPRLDQLKDDPYRSLAGAVRDAGGFAKPEEPFLEFLWANYFRDLIQIEALQSNFKAAVKKAVKLAALSQARHLPGWCGPK